MRPFRVLVLFAVLLFSWPVIFAEDAISVHLLLKKDGKAVSGTLVGDTKDLQVTVKDKMDDDKEKTVEAAHILYLVIGGKIKETDVPDSVVFSEDDGKTEKILSGPLEFSFKVKNGAVSTTYTHNHVRAVFFTRPAKADTKPGEVKPAPKEEAPSPLPSPPSPATPSAQRQAIALQLCKSTEAFPLMPLVRVVPEPGAEERDREGEATEEELNRLEPWAHFRGIPLYDARFDGAAHFPLPQFGLIPGERLYEEGAVVYEGMRFLAAADGHYEVQFTVSIPAMPVTLRLQLAVTDPLGRAFVITLPPIAIVPERSFRGNYVGSAWQVVCVGWSRPVGQHFAELAHARILRSGAARFGSWPEGMNTFTRRPD